MNKGKSLSKNKNISKFFLCWDSSRCIFQLCMHSDIFSNFVVLFLAFRSSVVIHKKWSFSWKGINLIFFVAFHSKISSYVNVQNKKLSPCVKSKSSSYVHVITGSWKVKMVENWHGNLLSIFWLGKIYFLKFNVKIFMKK